MTLRPRSQTWYDLVEQVHPRTGNWLSDTKDILLRFLQGMFLEMPSGQNLFHFEPGDETWETSEKDTELIITDKGSLNTDTIQKRPAIIISRGQFVYGDTSFDHVLNENLLTGARTHTDLLSGIFVLNCLSRSGLEAEKLALMVAKAVRIFREQLQNAGFFQIGKQIQIGEESPPGSLLPEDSQEDYVNVPVVFPVFYQESWTISQQATDLVEKILVTARFTFHFMDGSLVNPDCLDDDGNPIPGEDGVILSTWTIEE